MGSWVPGVKMNFSRGPTPQQYEDSMFKKSLREDNMGPQAQLQQQQQPDAMSQVPFRPSAQQINNYTDNYGMGDQSIVGTYKGGRQSQGRPIPPQAGNFMYPGGTHRSIFDETGKTQRQPQYFQKNVPISSTFRLPTLGSQTSGNLSGGGREQYGPLKRALGRGLF